MPAGSTFSVPSAQLIYTLEGSPAPQSWEIQSPLCHSEHEQKGVPLKLQYLTTVSILSDASTRWPSRSGAEPVSRGWGTRGAGIGHGRGTEGQLRRWPVPGRFLTTSLGAGTGGRRHPAAFPPFLTTWEVPRQKEGRFELEKAEKRSLGTAVNGPHGSQCPRNSLCAAQRGGC